ncbi:hypothetical protein F2P79_022617 [Pimephales promelas]|nr:hypothetical protein F2P79_022617 [Pimephales promelas]
MRVSNAVDNYEDDHIHMPHSCDAESQWEDQSVFGHNLIFSERLSSVLMLFSETGWKMYFETLRRKYSLAQPEKAQKRKTMTSIAKNLQRKRLLLETRSGVVQTNTEKELWKTATIELMSDEDDAIVDGRPV